MGKDAGTGAGQTKAVDDARVVEEVAEDEVVGVEEGGQDADVELEAAREQQCVLGAGDLGQTGLDSAVDRVIAADQSGSGRAGVGEGEVGEGVVIGETEIIVAAEADDWAAVDAVADSLAGFDARRGARETGLV